MTRFFEYCSTFKMNGVQPEAIRLILFPFSFMDRAKRWYVSHQYLISLFLVYFMYLILWAVYVFLRMHSVSLLSVYYPYLKPWAVYVCLTSVYFWYIFRIFSGYDLASVSFLFISFKRGRICEFYLVSFDFNWIK